MKKYVFIVPSIANMGGAQMYIRNKVLWLRQHGWEVDVIVSQGGVAKLSELKEFNFFVPVFAFDIYNYSDRRKKREIDRVVKKIASTRTEDTVIESTCTSESTWAEAVANRIGAKHISFLLQEYNALSNTGTRNFFLFKHKRKELFGITNTSLSTMFESFHPIAKEESYRLPAYCNNVEADVDSPYIKRAKDAVCDYRIGLLSRLEKSFVIPAVKDFCQFANNYQDKKFLLLLMGNAPKGSGILTQIQDYISEQTTNISVLATGYIYPVPTKLLEECDAFFTSAGSSWACMRSGAPTITYDGNDNRPIGILGRTTNNTLFRGENESVQNFSKLMDEILIEKKYPKEAPNYKEGLPDFSDHIKALEETAPDKAYYDVESIKPESKSDYKLKWALSVIGPENYLRLGFLKEKWTRRK